MTLTVCHIANAWREVNHFYGLQLKIHTTSLFKHPLNIHQPHVQSPKQYRRLLCTPSYTPFASLHKLYCVYVKQAHQITILRLIIVDDSRPEQCFAMFFPLSAYTPWPAFSFFLNFPFEIFCPPVSSTRHPPAICMQTTRALHKGECFPFVFLSFSLVCCCCCSCFVVCFDYNECNRCKSSK